MLASSRRCTTTTGARPIGSSPSAMAREPVPRSVRSAYALFYLNYLGRYREAVGELERAMKDDPLSVEQRYKLGTVLLAAGRDAEGMVKLLNATEIDEAFMPLYVVMGFAQTRRRQFAEALVNAERAHALGAWDPVVMGLFGAALINTGDGNGHSRFSRRSGMAALRYVARPWSLPVAARRRRTRRRLHDASDR